MKMIADKILKLKKAKNAVILAHNYQLPEVQDIADYHGDSLGLSIAASKTSADIIVFCGVYFMAETAAILCPQKKVLMPDLSAGCPMADMLTVPQLKKIKAAHPGAKVVCYVNSSAAVKAESDICCTSANSVKVCRSLANTNEIIFVPDKYLGNYTSTIVKEKKFILSDGFCPTHVRILPGHVEEAKKKYPRALVLVHPECRAETAALADKILSTGGMERFARESSAQEFIIGTETGMVYRLQKDNPGKNFYPAAETAVCPNMRKTTLEKVLWCLEDEKELVAVPEDLAQKAKKTIERMLS